MNEFNAVHHNIKFSLEQETGGCLNFLDVSLRKRDNGTLSGSIFRKSSWTVQYVHFVYFIPLKLKRNLVKSLRTRTVRIYSEDAIEQNIENLIKIVVNNGYPIRFIPTNMDKAKQAN